MKNIKEQRALSSSNVERMANEAEGGGFFGVGFSHMLVHHQATASETLVFLTHYTQSTLDSRRRFIPAKTDLGLIE